MQKVWAAEGLPFMSADGTILYLCCGKFKNNFKHNEALRFVRVPINIYYYEQVITLFVILLAEATLAWFNSM